MRWFILAAIILLPRLSHGQIVLKGERWDVAIDPATLAVEGRVKGGPTVVISSPFAKAATVAERAEANREASWTLPEAKLAVTMRIDDGDVLAIDFVATAAGELTWPTVEPSSAPRAYVLPMFEGLYVPADDEPWAAFLARESPMNTTAGLSMPFWGLDVGGGRSLTYILTNPFNNELAFERNGKSLGLRLTHAFTPNVPDKRTGFRIHLGDGSSVTPAKLYRQHVINSGEFVSLKEKIAKTPDAAKLLGAPHVYLWGDGLITRADVRDYKRLAARINTSAEPVAKRMRELLSADVRKLLTDLPNLPFVDNFQKGQVADELNRILKRRDLSDAPPELDDVAVARRNIELFHAAFSDVLHPPQTWGDGFSLKMIQSLADAGIDRAWLGSPNWDGLNYHPDTTAKARSLGYLVAPYDSYHSIHPTGASDTWETAQFPDAPELYEAGAIVKADGSKRKGFKQKGHLLSPAAARPHVERRVNALIAAFKCNSWFVDCDAFGDVFDDYSPAHPMMQASDAAERLSRMAWIRDSFGAVIGSEGGSAYAAPVIHFAHGIMTPVVAWGDPDLMKDKQSKFYLGGYYPPDGPAIFFKQVPMKDEHRRVYADPRFRLPLYQVVFHDSVVATHQWGYGSLKFEDPNRDRELLELLYNVPPLYHLNLAEWAKRRQHIQSHFAFFSPIDRETGLLPMTGFRWVTDDRRVQETTFGDGDAAVRLIANFGDEPFSGEAGGPTVPPHSILARRAGGEVSGPYPSPN